MSCDDVEARLTERFLARGDLVPVDAAHVAECARCGAAARELTGLTAHLAALEAPSLRPGVQAACEQAALRALRRQSAAHRPAPFRGLGRDLVRAALLGLAVLPVAVVHALAVAWAGSTLLGPVLPAAVLSWLAVLYFAPLVLGLGVLYGAIPLAVVAGRRGPPEEEG